MGTRNNRACTARSRSLTDHATLPYLILAHILSLFGPLGGWPGMVYFYDSTLFTMKNKSYVRVPFFYLPAS